MRGKKVLDLLKSLSVDEKEDLSRGLQLERAVSPAADWLCGLLADSMALPELLKKKAEKLSDQQIRNVLHRALSRLEQFLVRRHLQRRPILEEHVLLIEYRRRNLKKHFSGIQRSLERKREAVPGESGFLSQYLQFQEQNQLLELGGSRYENLQLQEASNALESAFLIARLKLACEMRNLQEVTGKEFDQQLFTQVLPLITEKHLEIPLIGIYYHIYFSIESPDEEQHYRELREGISKLESLEIAEQKNIYLYAFNYCTRKINKGSSKYLAEIFSLYKSVLENEVIFENGVLSVWNYKNIVTVGLRMGEFDWVGEFIEQYRNRLPKAARRNAYYYNRAMLQFYLNQYAKVLTGLSQVELNDVFYALDARSLLLKVYFETQETDALYSLFASFRAFLRRKVISDQHRINYSNFLTFARRLYEINPRDKVKNKRLLNSINNEKQLAERNWLLSKTH